MPRHSRYFVIWHVDVSHVSRLAVGLIHATPLPTMPRHLLGPSYLSTCKDEPSRTPCENQINDVSSAYCVGDYKACGLDGLLTVLEGTEPFSQASWLSPCGHEARRTCTLPPAQPEKSTWKDKLRRTGLHGFARTSSKCVSALSHEPERQVKSSVLPSVDPSS
jgi:hypothetical protein